MSTINIQLIKNNMLDLYEVYFYVYGATDDVKDIKKIFLRTRLHKLKLLFLSKLFSLAIL